MPSASPKSVLGWLRICTQHRRGSIALTSINIKLSNLIIAVALCAYKPIASLRGSALALCVWKCARSCSAALPYSTVRSLAACLLRWFFPLRHCTRKAHVHVAFTVRYMHKLRAHGGAGGAICVVVIIAIPGCCLVLSAVKSQGKFQEAVNPPSPARQRSRHLPYKPHVDYGQSNSSAPLKN